MEKIVREVRDIDGADRDVLERLIGRRLNENQQVIVDVVDACVSSNPPDQPSANEPQSGSIIPEWWKVYEGLSDDQIDRLDAAIRERANLTRILP